MSLTQTLEAFCLHANECLAKEGYDVMIGPGDLGQDFLRFERGGTLNGYAKLHAVGEGFVVDYGDFKTGAKGRIQSKAVEGLSEAELARIAEEAEAARRAGQEEAARECRELWPQLHTAGTHPYIEAKGLRALHGARVECHAGTDVPMHLVVPLVDTNLLIHNLQRIGTGGQKRFYPGAALTGLAHVIFGDLDEADFGPGRPVLLCEGYATGATLREATGFPVLCAMNANNMRTVALAWAPLCPGGLIVCADNDWKTEASAHGANPGERAGLEAATVCGGKLVLPRREDLGARGSDFNDMAAVMGIDAVRDYILGEIQQLETTHGREAGELRGVSKGANEREALSPAGQGAGGVDDNRGVHAPDQRGTRKTAPVDATLIAPRSGATKIPKPNESDIARLVAKDLQPCVSVLGDLYRFVDSHWRPIEDEELAALRRRVMFLSGGMFKSRDVSSCLASVHMYCTNVGPEFYAPKPNLANFLDGTLELTETGKAQGAYKLTFREHRADDHITHVIPLEYKKARARGSESNPLLGEMLERIFGECADKADRIRAIKQMYGACLIPFFPRLFILHGPGGSGKSSLIILATKLVSMKNCAMLDPQDFNGFHLEAMIGKLINVVTDIDTTFAIKDGVVKKIEDRVPFLVNRKFKKAVPAPLPAVHIFGANEIPRTLDGASGAHVRRWSFVGLPHAMVAGSDYQRNFVELLWNAGPEAVLAFALEGLDDLVASDGRFFNPASGVERLQEWQLESDFIGQFLADIRSGEHEKIRVDAAGKITRAQLWDAFKMWFEDSHPSQRAMGKILFFRRLRQKGIAEKTIQGVDYFEGYQTTGSAY